MHASKAQAGNLKDAGQSGGGKWEGPMGVPVSITGANLTGHVLAGSWGDITPAVLCITSEPGDTGLISDSHLSTLTRLCC